jgi:hypothetical protein
MTQPSDVALIDQYPNARVTEIEFSALPYDDIDYQHFTVTVAYRGRDLWAVVRHGSCLHKDGKKWDYEPMSSGRTDRWLKSHRFPLDAALKLAAKAVEKVTVNGMNPKQLLIWREMRHESAQPSEATPEPADV